MNEDIVSLEMRISYFEEMLDELNKIVYKQQVIIDDQQKTIAGLSNRVQQIGSSQVGDQSVEAPPPHY